jgi:hypothetical protein
MTTAISFTVSIPVLKYFIYKSHFSGFRIRHQNQIKWISRTKKVPLY